jgi:hypothetical protein
MNNDEGRNSDNIKVKKSRKYVHLLFASGIFIGFWLFVYYLIWIYNPLPSDESMIRNFKEHRADFVEAVRRYREYPRPNDKDTSLWFEEGDTLEVYRKAGISRIKYWTPIWFPNPYSKETYRKIEEERKDHIGFGLSYKYGALKIVPATPQTKQGARWDWANDRAFRKSTIIRGVIWKDYNFFPEPPRIENGKLLGPVGHTGEYIFQDRVLSSLNHIPPNWKDFECVFRQLEPQWFLRLCKGH